MGGFFDMLVPNCFPNKQYLKPSRWKDVSDAVQVLANNIPGKHWIRNDMHDGEDGPILGDFTPFSSNGRATSLDSCAMSYLFDAHADS